MSKRFDYSQYGPEQSCNDIGTNTMPDEGRLCSKCGRVVSNNLHYFEMSENPAINLATTVPIVSDQTKYSDELKNLDIHSQDKKFLLSKASSEPAKYYGSSKRIIKKNIYSDLKASPSQKRAAIERERRMKEQMQQSVVTVTTVDTKKNLNGGSDVAIDSVLPEINGKLPQEHEMATPICEKPQMKKKICRKRNKRNTGGDFEEEKDIDNKSNNSSIPENPKNKVEIQDGPCKATVTVPKKKIIRRRKKNVCNKFRYVIETSIPLPYGEFTVSVDKNSITRCADSEDESSDCSCDECQKNCKRGLNNKIFIRRYKNKNACKRASKQRR
ncbi:uncharacterized protein LOC119670098 [Teleopsis dalmanni]|uniref:uncharacterized protein LOC119670098 n=1 Tax=Teleopsis dalmanni TaxID=139649 RepID=UPI0018CC9F91|nr:uncharacterized protein LOC119670098 [Teleopsis dalmanni]